MTGSPLPGRPSSLAGAAGEGRAAPARDRTPGADARELRALLSAGGRLSGGPGCCRSAPSVVEAVASRAFERRPASAEFSRAMAEGQWDRPSGDGPGIVRGRRHAGGADRTHRARVERGGQNWTLARRKVGIQRVLDASRIDTRHLQQRLAQLVRQLGRGSGHVRRRRCAQLGEERCRPAAPNGRCTVGEPLPRRPAATAAAAAPLTSRHSAAAAVRAEPAARVGAWARAGDDRQCAAAGAARPGRREPRVARRSRRARARGRRGGEPGGGRCARERVPRRRAGAAAPPPPVPAAQQATAELTASLTDVAENDSWVGASAKR